MSEPSGLLEHLEQRIGPVHRVESARSERGNRGYDLAIHRIETPPVTTVATNGLRFQSITSMLPEEFVCSLRSDQEHIAHYLVDSVATLIIGEERGMEYGSVVANDVPIVRNTEIVGALAHVSPMHDEAFNLFPNRDAPTVQIISLVPITAPEARFVREEGPDGLFDVFRLNRVNILDVTRRSAV